MISTHRLYRYLKKVEDENILPETTLFAWLTYLAIYNLADGQIRIPDAGNGPNGEMMFSWNTGDHHFEVEIFPNGTIEFFAMTYSSTTPFYEYETFGFGGTVLPEGMREHLVPHFQEY